VHEYGNSGNFAKASDDVGVEGKKASREGIICRHAQASAHSPPSVNQGKSHDLLAVSHSQQVSGDRSDQKKQGWLFRRDGLNHSADWPS